MRIWSLHPGYLDRQGLVACWRETLLAQAVLAGRTRGYTKHSQLARFRAAPEPLATVGAYLLCLADEATGRGYRFDATRIDTPARVADRASGGTLPNASAAGDAPDGHRGPGAPGGSGATAGVVPAVVVPRRPVTQGQVDHEWRHLMAKLAARSPERHAVLRHVTDVAVHPLFVVVSGPTEPWERI